MSEGITQGRDIETAKVPHARGVVEASTVRAVGNPLSTFVAEQCRSERRARERHNLNAVDARLRADGSVRFFKKQMVARRDDRYRLGIGPSHGRHHLLGNACVNVIAKGACEGVGVGVLVSNLPKFSEGREGTIDEKGQRDEL
jgi:hypothetical protein